jgi:uncharacterized membrane protein SirB2
LLRAAHVACLALWVAAAVTGQLVLWRVRRGSDPERELRGRRRAQPLLAFEHLAFAALLASGAWLMLERGFRVGQPHWFGVKLGLVAFLFLPLEAMHAYIGHVWIARGLGETAAPPFSKDLTRGIGMDDMVRTLALLLLGVAVPIVVWLSVRRPF